MSRLIEPFDLKDLPANTVIGAGSDGKPVALTLGANLSIAGGIISAAAGEGGPAFPVDSIFLSMSSTNPATSLGYGTWSLISAGRMLVGVDAGDPDFDAAGDTGGAKAVTLGTAEMPAHNHVQDAHGHGVTDGGHNHTQVAHTHVQDAHTHTQNSHNHTQDSHNHTQNSFAPRILNSGTAGTVGVQGASAASNANASNAATTATNQVATATNQAATAVNQNATATNQNATATNNSATTGATVNSATATNQATGGGGPHNNLPPFFAVYMFRRTA